MQDERQKTVKIRRSYNADFEREVTRMLASGRSAKEISEAFGIAEKRYAVAASLSLERMATKKIKSTPGENGNDKSSKLAAEVAKLRDENAHLKTDRVI